MKTVDSKRRIGCPSRTTRTRVHSVYKPLPTEAIENVWGEDYENLTADMKMTVMDKYNKVNVIYVH